MSWAFSSSESLSLFKNSDCISENFNREIDGISAKTDLSGFPKSFTLFFENKIYVCSLPLKYTQNSFKIQPKSQCEQNTLFAGYPVLNKSFADPIQYKKI
jgi:hypothetical protein